MYEQAGVLNYTILPSQVPASFPVKLNTASFKTFIPALYAKYPNMNMTATAAAIGSPLNVIVGAGGMLVHGTGILAFDVILPSQAVVPDVFVVGVDLFASGRAWVTGDGTHNSLVANLTLVNVTMSVASSTIGPINLNPLQFALNIFTDVSG